MAKMQAMYMLTVIGALAFVLLSLTLVSLDHSPNLGVHLATLVIAFSLTLWCLFVMLRSVV